MKAGDYVKMRSEGIWYGEVVGIKTDTLEVYYIEKGDDNVWAYSEEWHEVPKESVLEHIKTSNVVKGSKIRVSPTFRQYVCKNRRDWHGANRGSSL